MKHVFLFLTLVLSYGSMCSGECCFDSDVAYTGAQILERQFSDPYLRQILERDCTYNMGDPETCTEEECKEKSGKIYGLNTCIYFKEYPTGSNQYVRVSCHIFGTPYTYTNFNCPESFSSKYYCNDLQPRVGSYCSRGSCNFLGCACDGGCIERPRKRKLLQGVENIASEARNETNVVGRCQEKVVSLFKTTSLRTKEQVQAYFDCLDSNMDGVLNAFDASVQFLNQLSKQYSNDVFIGLASMDVDQSESIEPLEFDPLLKEPTAAAGEQRASASWGGVSARATLVCFLSVLFTSLVINT